MSEVVYPPESHALRDLPFELVVVDDAHHVAEVDLDRGLVQGMRVSVGALATIVDVLAGALCGRAIAPDWMATSSLTLHLGAVPRAGRLLVDARVARLGRTTLVIQVGLREGRLELGSPPGAATIGDGVVTFSRLPRRDTNLDIGRYQSTPGQRTSFALDGTGLGDGGFEHAIGCQVLDAATGSTLTTVQPYVQNSFGAVNGGIVGAIADVAARSAVGAAVGADADSLRTTDLSVHHLSQVRQGAVASRATVLGHDRGDRRHDGARTVRVELFDAEGEGATVADPEVAHAWATAMAVAHVTVQVPRHG